MVSPHGWLGFMTLPYHDWRPFFYLTSSHLAESRDKLILSKVQSFNKERGLRPSDVPPESLGIQGRIADQLWQEAVGNQVTGELSKLERLFADILSDSYSRLENLTIDGKKLLILELFRGLCCFRWLRNQPFPGQSSTVRPVQGLFSRDG